MPTAAQHLNDLWHRSYTPPDAREIYDWAAEEVELPNCYAVTGRFDYSSVPFVKAPFEALRRSVTREVVAMAGVQCLKTLIGELWLLHTIVENPGPSQWLQPTDEEAAEHASERFLQLMAGCAAVHRLYTDRRHDKTTAFIHFKHMFLRMEGVTNRGNLQRKSIKNQMRSEVWQSDKWTPGKLREADSRMTQFVHNSKAYTESQPGLVGDDLHERYLAGTQQLLHFACIACGFNQPFKWVVFRPDGTRAGMRWEESERTRRPSGEWRWQELLPTVRYECSKCGFGHVDDPLTRRRLTNSLKYFSQNPEAGPSLETFSWNQLAVPNLSWFETKIGGVKNFLIAHEQAQKGVDGPQREFFQKVLAEPFDPDRFAHTRLPTIELTTPKEGKFWPLQDYIFMSVDVQMDHFWVLVQAWSKKGDDLTLFAGKLFSWEEVAVKQKDFFVPDRCVFVDAAHDQNTVYAQCVKHGHIENSKDGPAWICWTALKGDDRKEFIWTPSRGPQRGRKIRLPYSWPPGTGDPSIGQAAPDESIRGRYCAVIFWSNPTIKDIAKRRRDQMLKGVTSLVSPGDWNEEFSKQMFSERKKKILNSLNQVTEKWERIGKRPNHLWDCFCMALVAACMAQILGDPLPPSSLPPSE